MFNLRKFIQQNELPLGSFEGFYSGPGYSDSSNPVAFAAFFPGNASAIIGGQTFSFPNGGAFVVKGAAASFDFSGVCEVAWVRP